MSHPHLIEAAADALEFAFGGAARFTLVSKKTGERKTFRIAKAQDKDDMFFASLLTGPDNTEDYTYLGFYRRNGAGVVGSLIAGKKGNSNHPAFKALNWSVLMMETNGQVPEQLEFWHEGRCARCARVLTDPVSIERGLGPECAGKA